MDRFYTVDNFRLCMTHFQKFLEERRMVIPQNDLKDIVYRHMVELKNSPATDRTSSLRAINNVLLNAVRREVTAVPHELPHQQEQQQLPLQQQQQHTLIPPRPSSSTNYYYTAVDDGQDGQDGRGQGGGDQQGQTMQIRPVSTVVREDIDRRYEQLLNDRDLNEDKPLPDMPKELLPQDSSSIDVDRNMYFGGDNQDFVNSNSNSNRGQQASTPDPAEFAKQLWSLGTARGFGMGGEAPPPFTAGTSTLPAMNGGGGAFQMNDGIPNGMSDRTVDTRCDNERCDFVQIPPAAAKTCDIVNYVSVNGFDRDWVVHKNRYGYHIDLGTRFRNVESIRATCLIVPMEILEKKTLTLTPKTNFTNEYGLAHPYILLSIDEFTDVYEGSNSNVRSSFATFVYESSYRSPNGRGYMILRPIQGEVKRFRPAPLASLASFTLAIQKPNGTLYNNSIDDFGVAKLLHEDFNRMYLKIVTTKFFDRNEFYIGDTVLIRGFEMACSDPAKLLVYTRVNEFMNRQQGHEIVEIGRANVQGFHNNFYILAPGVLDQLIGRVSLDADVIKAINAFNRGCNEQLRDDDGSLGCSNEADGDASCCKSSSKLRCTDESEDPPDVDEMKKSIGHIINASLQNVLSFEVVTKEGDHSVLGVSIVGKH